MTPQDHQQVEQVRDEESVPPAMIELGDAATLTKGNSNSSVEAKQTPYS